MFVKKGYNGEKAEIEEILYMMKTIH